MDVAENGNQLPQGLRGQLFWLYRFTDTHSRKVLAGNATADVLVDINLAVLRGLRGDTSVPTDSATGHSGGRA